ncbi:esterase [Listeria grandensis]|uniref:Esterase n=1 Tax=Listeria grandensis TaxID=1494963 RepID=A0A7X0Y6C0_9LIST|nr:esterase [Listeria grandensis]MBC1474710.1 esterase [Listeria grandensis]MBC1937217.1 esterase [Listeria grandensis]
MIQVEHKCIKEIPVLHIFDGTHATEKLPTVFFYHGFQSQKELYLPYAYLLAQRGMRVILPDAPMHGERQAGESDMEQEIYFWDTVRGNIDELPILKAALDSEGLIDTSRLAIGGFSMGAITSFGMLAQYEWLKVGVCLAGSSYYGHFAKTLADGVIKQGLQFPFDVNERILELAPYDLSAAPAKLKNRPLMMWHGKEDDVVPFQYSEKLYEALVEEDMSDNVAFIVDEKAKHKISMEGMLAGVGFLEEKL